MSTGYGYVDRQVDSQIDWSAVASGFTETLQAEIAGRQAKKDELDKAAREMQERLANAPSGTYTEANEFAAQFAADGSATMLAANRALKAGLLQPRQYSLIAANLNSSTDKVYGMAEKYEEVYKLKMERQKNGESQAYEGWEMDQIGGLYNIQNTKALINQNNGMVSIGHWEDGKMDGDPNQFMTVNQMTAALNSQYDNFDLQKAIQDDKSRVGMIDSLKMQYGGEGDLEYLIKTRSQGGKYSKDAEEIKLYQEWRDETTARFMVNDWDVVSVLTDEGLTVNGKPYTFSKDPADKGEEGIIFIDTSKSARGVPDLTDKQKKAAEDHIKGQIDASINKEITTQTSRRGFEPPDKVDRDAQLKAYTELAKLYYDDDAGIESTLGFVKDLNKDSDNKSLIIKYIDRTPKGVRVQFADGTTETVNFVTETGQQKDMREFVTELINKAKITDNVGDVLNQGLNIPRLKGETDAEFRQRTSLNLGKDNRGKGLGRTQTIREQGTTPANAFETSVINTATAQYDPNKMAKDSGNVDTRFTTLLTELRLPGYTVDGGKIKDPDGKVIASYTSDDADSIAAAIDALSSESKSVFSSQDIVDQTNQMQDRMTKKTIFFGQEFSEDFKTDNNPDGSFKNF